KKKRGRKGAKSKGRAARRGLTVKEKASFVFKHRYLIVKREENLTESERDDLRQMQEYLLEPAQLTDALGNTETLDYNANGLATIVIDRLNLITQYAYSSSGNITQETYPDGTTDQYTYNSD